MNANENALACILIDASRASFEAETSVCVLVSRWHVSCCKATKVEPFVIAFRNSMGQVSGIDVLTW